MLVDFFLTPEEAGYTRRVLKKVSKDGEDEKRGEITRQRRDALALMTILREYESDCMTG